MRVLFAYFIHPLKQIFNTEAETLLDAPSVALHTSHLQFTSSQTRCKMSFVIFMIAAVIRALS
jgi:hypothetical protein